MNVCHLQAHVSYLLSHVSEMLPPSLPWWGVLAGFTLAPFLQLNYDPSTHMILKCEQAGAETPTLQIRDIGSLSPGTEKWLYRPPSQKILYKKYLVLWETS
jgi:hypothetical protein